MIHCCYSRKVGIICIKLECTSKYLFYVKSAKKQIEVKQIVIVGLGYIYTFFLKHMLQHDKIRQVNLFPILGLLFHLQNEESNYMNYKLTLV